MMAYKRDEEEEKEKEGEGEPVEDTDEEIDLLDMGLVDE